MKKLLIFYKATIAAKKTITKQLNPQRVKQVFYQTLI